MAIWQVREKYDLLKEIKKELQIDKFDSDELEELCDNLGSSDFTVELDGGEYRFIDEDSIEEIYEEEIQRLVEECYFGCMPNELPWWIAIDWTKTAENCLVDGYGHTFSTYDGSEYNIAGYYIFRTN